MNYWHFSPTIIFIYIQAVVTWISRFLLIFLVTLHRCIKPKPVSLRPTKSLIMKWRCVPDKFLLRSWGAQQSSDGKICWIDWLHHLECCLQIFSLSNLMKSTNDSSLISSMKWTKWFAKKSLKVASIFHRCRCFVTKLFFHPGYFVIE